MTQPRPPMLAVRSHSIQRFPSRAAEKRENLRRLVASPRERDDLAFEFESGICSRASVRCRKCSDADVPYGSTPELTL
jgi:hypothetical protein